MKNSLLLITAALALGGCRTMDSSSDVKSLDNFTGTADVVNSCSGTNGSLAPDGAISGPSAEAIDAAVRALGAVPASLQKDFFGRMQGRIEIGPIPEGCQAGSEKKNDQVIACYSEAADGSSLTIHIADVGAETAANTGHALVRTFGYVVSDVMLSYPKAQGQEPTKPQYLTDLSSSLYDLVQEDLLAKGRGDLMSNLDRDAVLNSLFAESFDSRYCSADTRHGFDSEFPLTASKFEEQFASQLDEALGGDGSGMMGLWGQWGFGNGPLRQAFSNWLDWRADGNGLFNVRRWADGGGLVFYEPWFNPFQWDTIAEGGYVPSYDQSYSTDGTVYGTPEYSTPVYSAPTYSDGSTYYYYP